MKKTSIIIFVFIILLSYQTFGQTWSWPWRLTWLAGDSEFPSIAADSSTAIYVVWQDITPGNREIFFKRSTDSGTSWSALIRLTWTYHDSKCPSIETDSGKGVHVVWSDLHNSKDYEIYYKKSTNGGTSWSALTRLTWNTGDSEYPSIAADSGNIIHIVWQDNTWGGQQEICYKSNTDGGTEWSAIRRLTWNTGNSECPSIAVDSGDKIHVVWQDNTPGNWVIFYKRSIDSGTTWSALTRLTWSRDEAKCPSITADSSGGIHLVWQGGHEIYYKKSSDGGSSWSALTRLTWNPAASEYPDIAAGLGNTIHVVWQDWTWEEIWIGHYSEICYKGSSDGGATWTGLTRVTHVPSDSLYPSIAEDSSGAVHLVYEDKNPGQFDIFYKIYK